MYITKSMDFFCDTEIYKRSYAEALNSNETTINKISNFEKELRAIHSSIEENPKYLHRNVIIPLCSKAMIKGKLVHTNEVYVNLGDRWFLKTSYKKALEICERMIGRCHANMLQFEKEKNLLRSNLNIPAEMGVFPDEMLKEIVEPYDDEYEAYWREEHRKRVREHSKRGIIDTSTDDVLFNKLDQLEAEETDISIRSEDELDQKRTVLNSVRKCSKRATSSEVMDSVSPIETKAQKNPFSSEDSVTRHELCTSKELDENCIIYFKHSEKNAKSYGEGPNGEIMSPNDICGRFANHSLLQSIIRDASKINHIEKSDKKEAKYFHPRQMSKTVNVLGDVLEKKVIISKKRKTEESRHISKFKSCSQKERS